jgi:hypothetical protein
MSQKKKDKKNKKSIKEKIKDTLRINDPCDHVDFWKLYRIINFHRTSMKMKCPDCKKTIAIEYRGAENFKKDILVRGFSAVLWMSPALLIVTFAVLLAEIYGPWMYFLAIIDVIIFHFWAMYYIIK